MERQTVVVFSGTSEGIEICRFLQGCGVRVVCSVATDYGSSFPGCESLQMHVGRLTREGMEELLLREGAVIGVDATHPYASEAHENIHQACHFTEIEYLRVSRASTERDQEVLYLKNHEKVLDFLSHTQGNILLTTGSKDLGVYMTLPEAKERIYARVLSLPQVILECERLGLEGRHLIAMQGPFSAELNAALLSQYDIRYMVSKDTGKEGGFPEKVEGARRAGVTLVVVDRPAEPEGLSVQEAKEFFIQALSLTPRREVTLLGIGMGGEKSLTLEGLEAVLEAELLVGAKRMLESLKQYGAKGRMLTAYRGEEILGFLLENPAYQKVVIALSGDVGFYSGARGILKSLQEAEITPRILCGISSVQYFFARLMLPWEDALLLSAHGTGEDLAREMGRHRKVFALLGSGEEVRRVAMSLVDRGEEEITLYVGERLSYPEEKILSGRPSDFLTYQGDSLSVLVSLKGCPEEAGGMGKANEGGYPEPEGISQKEGKEKEGEEKEGEEKEEEEKEGEEKEGEEKEGEEKEGEEKEGEEKEGEEKEEEEKEGEEKEGEEKEGEEKEGEEKEGEEKEGEEKEGEEKEGEEKEGEAKEEDTKGVRDRASHVCHLPDSAFVRGRIPMTKEEVRCIALSKLAPREGDICWDVGAGTGSVTAELGLSCPRGEVFAIEKEQEALDLIEKNVGQQGLGNVTLIKGAAPLALAGLPAPDRVFVGGSGGNLREILEVALRAARGAKKQLRVVVTCITLETMSLMSSLARELFEGRHEVTQVSIARAHRLGDYRLMKGENPVYLFTLWDCDPVSGFKAGENTKTDPGASRQAETGLREGQE